MRWRRGSQRTWATAAAIALLALPAGAAFADDKVVEEEETKKKKTRVIRQREILMASDGETAASNGWLGSNVHLHSKAGLAYTQRLEMGERPFVFHLEGPVLKKQKALGLSFRIHF